MFPPFPRSAKLPLAEVEQYIERISVPEDKYLLYMELKVYWKAMEVAAKLRSAEKLKEVSFHSVASERSSIDLISEIHTISTDWKIVQRSKSGAVNYRSVE